MWLLYALALLTLVPYGDAVNNVTPQCPKGCTCDMKSSVTQISMDIDCGQGFSNMDKEQLAHQLESMLSADQFIERLTSLSITNTPLTRVPLSVCRLVNLTSLNLDNNNITALQDNCFVNLAKLVTLSANRNSITGLQDGLLDGMQSLVTLDLSQNHISSIGLRVLSNSSDLTSLRSLNLNFNRLTSLEPWWYYRCILGDEKSPVTIALSRNWISNFTNKLNFHFRCNMRRPYGHLDLSWNRITHVMDIFNGWNIGDESLYISLLCLRNLKGAHPRMWFYFAGHYACDCTDFPFYKAMKAFAQDNLLDGVRCSEHGFYSDIGRAFATRVPLDQFFCELSDHCPSSCRCVYRSANATLHVSCSAANLSSLPLDLPPLPKSYVRYKLDFSNNKLLRRLEHRPYVVNTSVLDVSNCSLAEINTNVLKGVSRSSVVNLRRNILRSFPRQAVTVNISVRLLIGDNPWKCSCDNSWMIGWFQSLSRQILDPGDITCASPSRVYGRNVLKSTEEDFCVDPVKQVLTITLSVVASVGATVIITGTLLHKLRIQFYSRWKFHPFDRDECVGEDLDYDVFLSCSSADDDPHGLHILELMEAKDYRVCYHERDFLPGQRITESVGHAVERSKRTVCLISENFLRRLV